MAAISALFILAILIAAALLGTGVANLDFLFGVIFPYAAIAIFLFGFIYRIIRWAQSPVPFKITTTCGQQKSHDWIKNSPLEAPHSKLAVVGRMLMEILFFRSLFRNTKVDLKKDGPRIVYGGSKWLWLAGLAFHWSFLIILLRHYRFFADPVPFFVSGIESLDSFFQIGLPLFYITDAVLLAALTYLFLRRVADPKMRYITLGSDYFALFLLLAIGTTGVLMRYTGMRVDIISIKELAMGLVSLKPIIPKEEIGSIFYVHLFLVSVLFAYFPFSKLMHMGGVFMSPTRNLTNDNRARRHVNPWDYPVKTHSYEEWEDEFRDLMKAAGMPLEKEK